MIRHSTTEAALFTSTLPSGIDWHDARSMEPIDGPLVRYPMGRVLFLIHRCRATGVLRVFDGERSHGLSLRDGLVVGVDGVENLVGTLAPDSPADLELEAAVGRAMAAGHGVEAVLEEVCRTVAHTLASWCLGGLGIVSFKLEAPSGGSGFRLPWNLIAILSHGLHAAGSPELGLTLLETQPKDPVSVLMPDDCGEQRLGLDPLSLRVLNLARSRPSLQDLVAQATRGNSARRREVLHRLFVLHKVGVLHLPDPSLETDEETQRIPRRRGTQRPVEPSVVERSTRPEVRDRPTGGERRITKVEPPPEEDSATKLRAQVEALRTQNFYQRLGLGAATTMPSPKQADEAYHKLSRIYHPDGFAGSTEEVRDIAEDGFSLLTEAIDGLRKRRVAEEQWERNVCAQQGIAFVTERDRTKAKMSFKKGERLFRNRDYAIAEACFHDASAKDPPNPLYHYMHAYSAFLAKQMPPEEAIRIISGLVAATKQQESEFQHTLGRIIRLSGGSEAEALAHFEKALAANPDNRDAQRELRLNAMRTEAKPKATPSAFGSFLDRFRRKDKSES